ncbi:hypothetical protein [Actinocrispum sp. NPDC049592]|uniref:hypothetical protein n=1 Tax=Actinocrispum sp. NPDC049592 TaxID=3154835 RepID=UPI00342933A8
MFTLQEATRRVEDLAQHAMSLLSSAEAEKLSGEPSPCDDPYDGGPSGKFMAVAEYRIWDLAPADYPRHVDTLHTWWTANGFEILHDARPVGLYVWVENAADGFRMAVQANKNGALLLTATSPCVWPGRTPEG